jgi:hypothetical protein
MPKRPLNDQSLRTWIDSPKTHRSGLSESYGTPKKASCARERFHFIKSSLWWSAITSLENDWTGGFFLKKKNWHIESSTSSRSEHSEKVQSHSTILSECGWRKSRGYPGPLWFWEGIAFSTQGWPTKGGGTCHSQTIWTLCSTIRSLWPSEFRSGEVRPAVVHLTKGTILSLDIIPVQIVFVSVPRFDISSQLPSSAYDWSNMPFLIFKPENSGLFLPYIPPGDQKLNACTISELLIKKALRGVDGTIGYLSSRQSRGWHYSTWLSINWMWNYSALGIQLRQLLLNIEDDRHCDCSKRCSWWILFRKCRWPDDNSTRLRDSGDQIQNTF